MVKQLLNLSFELNGVFVNSLKGIPTIFFKFVFLFFLLGSVQIVQYSHYVVTGDSLLKTLFRLFSGENYGTYYPKHHLMSICPRLSFPSWVLNEWNIKLTAGTHSSSIMNSIHYGEKKKKSFLLFLGSLCSRLMASSASDIDPLLW